MHPPAAMPGGVSFGALGREGGCWRWGGFPAAGISAIGSHGRPLALCGRVPALRRGCDWGNGWRSISGAVKGLGKAWINRVTPCRG